MPIASAFTALTLLRASSILKMLENFDKLVICSRELPWELWSLPSASSEKLSLRGERAIYSSFEWHLGAGGGWVGEKLNLLPPPFTMLMLLYLLFWHHHFFGVIIQKLKPGISRRTFCPSCHPGFSYPPFLCTFFWFSTTGWAKQSWSSQPSLLKAVIRNGRWGVALHKVRPD